jgi:hypothetical protein
LQDVADKLRAKNITDNISPFMEEFDYVEEANILVGLMNQHVESFNVGLCDFAPYDLLDIQEAAPSGNDTNSGSTAVNDCDPDSIYDAELGLCICADSDDMVLPGVNCPVPGSDSQDTETEEEDIADEEADPDSLAEEESEPDLFLCEDGSVVVTSSQCPTAEISANNSGDDSDVSNLASNTQSNVLASGAIQGNTGIEIVFVLFALMLGLVNLAIWLKH